ncbi:adenosylcobinamide kinase/adenosylcobinamide phosphate guanyltransferase [Mycobacterium sp. 1164966.3]|uniref:bifunctional adenosylcobinamide kinase/adenosylcobinamide-phosphate guanylyltransferase n=1 Tax=Mycobacterium sp. 1164966.3 TaxID=1856861 RepID=UPI0007FE302F|nr:bifunctional adenosylcobinamide kinase/adenosylcobinamide-phosphate guanylyltransferase [Mycobacterium sp. 1164966.3]OBA80403.1 adenosylcobinamide kinase/adenosylcobinamide phosphate guanyltransferase [Mycobacterium sp. 1164966.3]
MRTLVLGGIRSGKSRWAEETIAELLAPDEPVCYLAAGSAAAADAEWAQRVAKHRDRRPAHWSTIETDDVATQLRRSPGMPTLVDDLGAWLTNVLDRCQAWDDGPAMVSVQQMIDDMIAAVSTFGSTLMLVSPEVGLTVVPATASGRRFADELGSLNQRVAALCERVVLVVAGQAVPIKPS